MPGRADVAQVVRDELNPLMRDAVLNRITGSALLPRFLRPRILNKLGHDIHRTAVINPGLFLGAWSGLTLKELAFINYGCFLDLGAPITMGKRSGIGYQTMLITCGHEVGPSEDRIGPPINQPIVIGDGCWIGSRVMIMPGVTVGDGCVIASGSVVTSDCEPDCFYAGTPAVLKRRLQP